MDQNLVQIVQRRWYGSKARDWFSGHEPDRSKRTLYNPSRLRCCFRLFTTNHTRNRKDLLIISNHHNPFRKGYFLFRKRGQASSPSPVRRIELYLGLYPHQRHVLAVPIPYWKDLWHQSEHPNYGYQRLLVEPAFLLRGFCGFCDSRYVAEYTRQSSVSIETLGPSSPTIMSETWG